MSDSLAIEAGRRRLQLSVPELWLEYVAIGGNATWPEVRSFLDGAGGLPDTDHDMLAQALNDRFTDLGMNHPIPYSDEGSS